MNGKNRDYIKCLPRQMYHVNLDSKIGCDKTKEECESAGGPNACTRYNDVRVG